MTSTTSIIGDFPEHVEAHISTEHGKTREPSFGGQKYATVTLTADGEIVAAVTGKKIRLLAMTLWASETDESVEVQIKSEDASGTAMSPQFRLGRLLNVTRTYLDTMSMEVTENWDIVVAPPLILPFNPAGWCATAVAEAMYADITIAGSMNGNVRIMVTYDEVGA